MPFHPISSVGVFSLIRSHTASIWESHLGSIELESLANVPRASVDSTPIAAPKYVTNSCPFELIDGRQIIFVAARLNARAASRAVLGVIRRHLHLASEIEHETSAQR